MRPEGISEDDLIRWEGVFQDMQCDTTQLVPPTREMIYASEWLRDRLTDLGCEQLLMDRIVFAAEQRQSAVDDPWVPVSAAVANYRVGKWEEPGEALALQILRERFGDKPKAEDLVEWMIGRGGNRERLTQILVDAALTGRRPVLPPVPGEACGANDG